MRTAIDDLPHVSASRMRAAGEIVSDAKAVTVSFPDGPSFTVGLQHIRFPNGGGWVLPCLLLRSPVSDAAAAGRPRLQGVPGGEGFPLPGRGSIPA